MKTLSRKAAAALVTVGFVVGVAGMASPAQALNDDTSWGHMNDTSWGHVKGDNHNVSNSTNGGYHYSVR